jgi:hypothetical protein
MRTGIEILRSLRGLGVRFLWFTGIEKYFHIEKCGMEVVGEDQPGGAFL